MNEAEAEAEEAEVVVAAEAEEVVVAEEVVALAPALETLHEVVVEEEVEVCLISK
jgi:hypothetical protein